MKKGLQNCNDFFHSLMNYEFIILACFSYICSRDIPIFGGDLFCPLEASKYMQHKNRDAAKGDKGLENEVELIKETQAGNHEAFSILSKHYLPLVYRRIWFSIPSEDAEDITQEVFVTLVRKISTFKGTAKFSTWLYTITNRKIADYYRRNKKMEMNFTLSIEESEIKISDPKTSDVEMLDKMIMLRKGFAQLPKQYKEVLILRLADGLKFQDVSQELGISYEATKSLFRRAMKSLRTEIGDS